MRKRRIQVYCGAGDQMCAGAGLRCTLGPVTRCAQADSDLPSARATPRCSARYQLESADLVPALELSWDTKHDQVTGQQVQVSVFIKQKVT
jgi:hypothetical protein